MDFIVSVVVLVVVAVIGFFIFQAVANSRKISEIGATTSFDIGRYLGGLAGLAAPTDENVTIKCAVTDSEFIFVVFGSEFGRIPRDSIDSIHIDDRSSVSSRLTATRIATLGVFSLAAPKNKREDRLFLTLDWQDEQAAQQQTIFEFSGIAARILANAAAEQLRKHIKPKVQRLAQDERKCPHCAEIIKSEARVCKHCGRDL